MRDDEAFDDQSTIAREKFDPTPNQGASFRVSIVTGPDAGKSWLIDGSEPSRLLVGQGPACALRVTDPSVSRRHAALELQGATLRVSDLGSKNGTIVNGLTVFAACLTGGEVVQLGGTSLRVELVPTSPERGKISVAAGFGRVVGVSTEMRRLYPLCEALAKASVPVILEGETGTGKELLAESLHLEGPRADRPFVVFDCTAVPPALLESELFGHERGAFTGATSARTGVFELANHGTLLIDEIGDLDISLQPKLLRVIERGELRRVGGSTPIRVDVRILAATRRDLDAEVVAGRFRDDLFHRLAVTRIELPPLRRRRGDIPILVRHFCQEIGGDPRRVPSELVASWERLSWPGNLRELRNQVARHLALGELANLHPERPRPPTVAPSSSLGRALSEVSHGLFELPLSEAKQRIVETFEQLYVRELLDRNGGNVTRAAVAAGVARRYFQMLKAKSSRSEQ